MFITVTENMFVTYFMRSDRGNAWSYEGLQALYALLTELDDDCGTNMEFDLIGLDCEFYEQSAEEIINDYRHLMDTDDIDPDNVADFVDAFLADNTIHVRISNDSFVYSRL